MQNNPTTADEIADSLLSLPFDHYERHAITRAIVGVARERLKRTQLKVLDVGGAPVSLPDFLPEDHILTADLEALDCEGYLRADGTALPFRDEAFDIVTCHDTLEHVPASHREAFLLELVRVTGDILIVNGPFSDPKVEAAERLVAQIVRDTVGEGHPTLHFLGEHAELGLPALAETLALIDRLGLSHTVVPNGPLDEWLLKMAIKHHLSALGGHGLHPHEFDRRNNEAYVPSTSAEPCYRQAVIILKRTDARLLVAIREKLPPTSRDPVQGYDIGVSSDLLRAALAHYLSLLKEGLQSKDNHIANMNEVVEELRQAVARLEAGLADKDAALAQQDKHIAGIEAALHHANVQAASSAHQLEQVRNSVGYRLLELVRRPIRWLAPDGTWRRRAFVATSRGLNIILSQGPWTFLRRAVQVWQWLPRLRQASVTNQQVSLDDQYQLWLRTHALTPARKTSIGREATQLKYRPCVSIIMPVYDPDPAWLRDAIESVRAQLYDNWELCIADDGSTRTGVRELLEESAQADERIRLTHIEKNQGISAASNAALALATGEFIGLLDHDDELKPDALFEVVKLLNVRRDLDFVYSDEDKKGPDGRLVEPFFKPGWSPDLLMSVNYVAHFSVFRKEIVDRLDGFRPSYDGSQDYDLVLRVTEITDKVAHIPRPLYTWRKVPGSAASSPDAKRFAYRAGKEALECALVRRGLEGDVLDGQPKGRYRVKYKIVGNPRVAIIIPTRDRVDMLRRCVHSIRRKSSYSNYEIIIIDNNSEQPETLDYLSSVTEKVITYPHEFNFARMMNFAAREADCDALIFLNNDTEVITGEWIEAMLEHGQRPEIAAVGARLLYPHGQVQHEGIIVGLGGGSAGNVDHAGYWDLGESIRNCSAVTAACMLTRPSVFWELGGFDERLRVAFNDVDFCLRAREKGYLIIYTPFSTLYHQESATRGNLHPDQDEMLFRSRWGNPGEYHDPYYNQNLDLRHPFTLRP